MGTNSAISDSTRAPAFLPHLHHYHHIPLSSSAQSHPPSKASLRAWWNQFTSNQKAKKEYPIDGRPRQGDSNHSVFGRPLQDSLRYASVQISTADTSGRLYVWGYIPVVVAKCGLYLKENATAVEGVFRVSGSSKRMRELQAAFETPPRYGKDLDWHRETYTAHDVASVFRRYLTYMPEPVIPWEMYHSFRNPLVKEHPKEEEIITTYKTLIRQLPRANQYLLLYVLDLLSVFARKSDKNLMTAENLAKVFQPGLISHPSHELSPQEHLLSQKVLEFLIAQQDWFMLDITPPNSNENPSRAGTPTRTHDIVMVSSRETEKEGVGGGWYHIEKTDANPPKMVRRRTTVERRSETRERLEELSPVAESPGSENSVPGAGVSRSRTLPSRCRGFTTSTGNETVSSTPTASPNGHVEKARVLRKPRPMSSQPHPNRLEIKDQ